jgi:hypothetical protein
LSSAAAAGEWLVFADASLGADIVRALGGEDAVTVLAPSALADEISGTTLLDALGHAKNVLYAADASVSGLDAAYQLCNTASRLSAALASTASPAKLFMLSHNARPVMDGDRANAAHAILWGLGRTLALEHPEIWGGIIELDDAVAAEPADDTGEQKLPTGDIKNVWRGYEPELRRKLLLNHVGVLVAAVMGLPSPQSLSPTADFFELGMDSMMSVVLQRALAETLGEVLDQSVIFDYPTAEELADFLVTLADADLSAGVS